MGDQNTKPRRINKVEGAVGQVMKSGGPGNVETWGFDDYGLSFIGTVTGVAGAPKFQCSGLAGFDNDFFNGYWAYVVWDAGGAAAQPQGQMLECTGYAAGDFTVAAFAPNAIAVGDKVLFLHPSMASLVNTTFGLAAIKALVDTTETDASFSYLDAGGEQDVYVDAVTTRRKISFAMDITTMTQGGVVKVYLKVDGANYKVWVLQNVDSIASGGTEDVYSIEVTTNQHFKVSYTEDADEGAARAIPYSVIHQVLE